MNAELSQNLKIFVLALGVRSIADKVTANE